MQSETVDPLQVLHLNFHLIVISLVGGFVLFSLKVAEHFMRSDQDKMPLDRYLFFVVTLLLGLPLLGAGVTAVYLMNGDKLSPILALQVGLTSPAIVQSLIIAAANSIAKNSASTVVTGQ